MPLRDVSVVHVSAWAKAFTQFRLPLITRLQGLVKKQVIYCPCDDVHAPMLREAGFDVRDVRISSSPSPALAAQALWLAGRVRRQGFNMLIAHQPIGALVGIPAAKLAGIPRRVYSTGGLKAVPGDRSAANRLLRLGEAKIMKWSDAVLLVNREDEALLKASPETRDKAHYVGPLGGCGIDTRKYNPDRRRASRDRARAELGIPDDVVVVGYTGRYVWEKGFRELIAAAAALKAAGGREFVVLAFGEGQHKGEIAAQVERAGVSNVFRLEEYRKNIDFWMSAFDIFVLPSYREGLPVSLLEAMCLGLPCVASDIRGCNELIAHERSGLLIPARDEAGLRAAIQRFADCQAFGRTMAEAGARACAEKYSEGVLLGNTLAIIANVAACGGQPRGSGCQ